MKKPDFNIRNDENKTCKTETFGDCASCKEFENYIQVASETRKRYREEKEKKWDDDELVVLVDMQKVSMMPRMPGPNIVVFCKRHYSMNSLLQLEDLYRDGRRKPLVFYGMRLSREDERKM